MQETLQNITTISDNPVVKILLIILLALITQIIVKKIIRSLLRIPLGKVSFPLQKREREKRIKTLTSIATATASLGVWFVAILMILGVLNIPIAPLLTSAGLIGAALAFGTQSLIKDFISGIFIIAENQYRVDDYVSLDKVSGKIVAVTVRTTIIKDKDGSLHHVPNGSIGVTTNLSMGPLIAHEDVDIDASVSVATVKKVLKKIETSITADEALARFVKTGPLFIGVKKASAKTTTITIAFETTAAKRDAASSIVWEHIKDAGLTLA